VLARLVLALTVAVVLGYRWQEGLLTWPLVLMSAFISTLLLIDIFTGDRRLEDRDFYADGRATPRRRATDYQGAEAVSQDRVTTSPDVRR